MFTVCLLTVSTKPTTSTMPTKHTMQARYHGRAFQGLAPLNHCLCPRSEDCAPKESIRPSAAGGHFKAVSPQITACAPQKWVNFLSRAKKAGQIEWKLCSCLSFCGKEFFYVFLVFKPESEGKNWVLYQRIASCLPPPPRRKKSLPGENCAPNKRTELKPRGFAMGTFFSLFSL